MKKFMIIIEAIVLAAMVAFGGFIVGVHMTIGELNELANSPQATCTVIGSELDENVSFMVLTPETVENW